MSSVASVVFSLYSSASADDLTLPTSGDGVVKKIMTAEDELDALIGLSAVKRMVKKIKAYAKRNKDDPEFNLHMCFYGNPGTAYVNGRNQRYGRQQVYFAA